MISQMIVLVRSTVRLCTVITLLTGIVFSKNILAADVEWNGWSFDYSTNDNASGLVIKNVEFNNKKILNKASMPVMRVEYDNDICGPYADIMSATRLRAATSGAPDSACSGLSVCRRTFTQNGQEMLEVGSNWQIGEYQIYQTYYFSDEGYFDARVYSRGLQCQVNHRHHAHWMFDFDIGDEINDRILRGGDEVQAFEFNDLTSQTSYWTIEDVTSGDSVQLLPSVDDGTADGFSKWDAAGRRYNLSEVGRWRLGARGEIGDNYNSPVEAINGEDIVFWYVSHLPHAASEGASVWHASGPRIKVVSNTENPVPPEPEPEPEPEPDPENLLINGGFEFDLAGWDNCGDYSDLSINGAASEGSQSLLVTGGGCLYQEVSANPGADYTLSCEATRPGSFWSIVEFSYLDSQYNALQSEVRQIATGAGFSEYVMSGTAPANTAYALALVYSEDQTLVDNCILAVGSGPENPQPPTPPEPSENILVNGGFESALSNWYSCAASDLASIVSDADSGGAALQVTGSGCMYQEFEIIQGNEYAMNCRARRDATSLYTSVSLTLMNADYAALESSETPVTSEFYSDYSAALTAPQGSKYGSIVVYSEDPAVFDNCVVSIN